MIKPWPARDKGASPQNIEEIYRQHFDMVYRISFSYLKNLSDAEDSTADVFAKLMQKNVTFQSDEHEKAWLIRTAINICKNHLSHWWRSRADIDDYENLHSDDAFHLDETLQLVMELPVRYKDVIYLYYYEGYTSKEIAEILQKPHSTIRNHLREARIKLRGVLENEK
ncbi:MAG: RNA polymerase sigma factor [Oscillospiraceae bacterium]|nr:RNA polymerase sigma factor [Oscillospiraceae bacterium]